MFKRYLLLISSLLAPPFICAAPTPSPAQIKMFQNLPKSQQESLAKQYGYSLPSSQTNNSNEVEAAAPVMNPREESKAEAPATSDKAPGTLKRFGIDLFASSPSTFAPVSDAPIPSNYQVGPGDEIRVQLFGKDNESYSLIVNREGTINFPNLGPISVAGKSFTQVKESLTKRINEQIIGVKSDISLGELRTMQVFVMGDAYKPGAYTVSALTTISQALYYSGGFSESGSLRDIELKRDGKIIRHLDLYKLLLNGDSSNDVRLQPNDVVLVGPVKNTVTIKGEVTRPAIYETKSGETIGELIHNAGGLTANAYLDKVQIKRLSSEGMREVLTINVNDKQSLTKKVYRGDEITISKISDSLKQYIKVDGDVAHPGYQEWKKGQRISDIFSSLDSAFNPTADVNYALVVREINPQHNIKVYQFSLANALLNPESQDNLELRSHDQILVFNRFGDDDLQRVSTEDQKTTVAKNYAQAKQEAEHDKAQRNQVSNGTNSIDAKHVGITEAKWLFQGSQVSEEQVQQLKNNSRRELLAQVLLKLRQQSIYGNPAQIVEITGEVKHPGLYPITQLDSVQSLVAAAGGLTQYAFVQHAELARAHLDNDGSHTNIIQFNLNDALIGEPKANLALVPNDKINILQQPGSKEKNTIELRGEVRFPGSYTVRKGETLGDLLKRAGGLTKYAYPQGAIFTRESLRLKEQELLQQYANDLRSDVAKKALNEQDTSSSVISDPDKTLSFIEEATKTKALGRLVIKLGQIEKGNLSADVPLEDGDFLYVPTYHNTISIMGEVQVGITYLLDPRLDVDDYIEKAGGMKKQADEDRVFIIHADGSIEHADDGFFFGRSSETLLAGDTIVVPVDTNYRDALNIWSTATQMLYQTGVAVNAIK